MLKAIVFDFDGVIVDSERMHYESFLEVARELGHDFTWEAYLEQFIGYDDRDVFRVLAGRPAGGSDTPEEAANIEALTAAKARAFQRLTELGVKTIPGVLELIAAVRRENFPRAIASGATRADIDLMLDAIGLTGAFDVIVSADDVVHSKPDPASYARATFDLAQRRPEADLSPANCLAIEDTAAGLASARGAGLMTLAITTTANREALARAHRVVDTFDGITLDDLRSWYG